ncbi:MAG TPA: trypsin-like peptidase domain-containing protein [Jiangellaceae bacterium]
MDDSTRTPHTQPDSRADQSTGTGWSTPQQGAPQPPDAPWSRTEHDTGSVPRPHDTRQFSYAESTNPTQETRSAGESSQSSPAPASQLPPPHYGGPAQAYAPPPPKGRRSTALIAAVALGAGLVGGAAGAGIVSALDDDAPAAPTSSLDNEAQDAADAPPSDIEAVAADVSPSVVSINIRSAQGPGSGSGVIISSDGQIMTNAHVAAAGEGGTLTVTFHDGSEAEAEVIGMDEETDIAVLQAEGVSGLEPAEFGNSDNVSVGSEVIAFGSPLGLEGTVTRGIVSALHRPVQAGDARQPGEQTLFEAIQTDASINPGNSGGPLVNTTGEVVGINTAIAAPPGSQGSIGLGFAIPINTARYIAEQIIDGGEVEYARIGIGVNNGQGGEPAATVAEVQEGSAADEAGLEQGDVITRIDGRPVPDATSLVAAARAYEPGDDVTLTYVRDGEEETVELTLGSSADDE